VLPRLLAALVVAAVGFVAAFFIGRATANEAEPGPLTARPGSVSVVVLPHKAPAIALPAKAAALPPLVQPPPTTQQSQQPASPSPARPAIGVG
jgi:hypothetical protein